MHQRVERRSARIHSPDTGGRRDQESEGNAVRARHKRPDQQPERSLAKSEPVKYRSQCYHGEAPGDSAGVGNAPSSDYILREGTTYGVSIRYTAEISDEEYYRSVKDGMHLQAFAHVALTMFRVPLAQKTTAHPPVRSLPLRVLCLAITRQDARERVTSC